MEIERLSLRHYRNYTRLDLPFGSGATLLYGPNAAGKTSILEAIALLALSKSPRTSVDRELIGWQTSHSELLPATARVSGDIRRQDRVTRLDVIIQARSDSPNQGASGGSATKVLRVDGKPVRAGDLIGFARMVFFAPTDLDIITGAPVERRRWIDAMLSQLDSNYLRTLNLYQKVITQRNSLLRLWREKGATPRNYATELAFWDEQLAQAGAYIMLQRRAALTELSASAAQTYAAISDQRTALEARYAANMTQPWDNQSDAHEVLLAAYKKSHTEDMARMQTTVGPHRDDVLVHDRGVDLGTFGSRGQQRSTVLALKMAEVAVMHARSGERPILLLDDVLSELDALRRLHILALISEPTQQSILTATGVGDFSADFLASAQVLRVDQGHVSDMR